MKFKDFVERVTEGVQISISIEMFGMKFSTTHYGGYYRKGSEEFPEIMEKEIKTISLCDGVVFLTFEE